MTAETQQTINSIRYVIEALAVAFIIWLATTTNNLESKVILLNERQSNLMELKADIKDIKAQLEKQNETLIKLSNK